MDRQVASALLADAEQGVALTLADVLGHGHALGVQGVPEEVLVPLRVPAGVASVQEGAVITQAPSQVLCVHEALGAHVEGAGAGLLAAVLPVRGLVALAGVAAGADAPVLLDHLALLEAAAGLHLRLLHHAAAPVGLDAGLLCCLQRSGAVTAHSAVVVPGGLHLPAVELIERVALVLGHDELCAVAPAEELHCGLALLVSQRPGALGLLLGAEGAAGAAAGAAACVEQHARGAAAVCGVAGQAGRRDLWRLCPRDIGRAVVIERRRLCDNSGLGSLCCGCGSLGGRQSCGGELGIVRRLQPPAPDTLAGRLGVEELRRGLIVVGGLCPSGELLRLCCLCPQRSNVLACHGRSGTHVGCRRSGGRRGSLDGCALRHCLLILLVVRWHFSRL